jgi:Zn-finger nucleic acid-binding protein
MTVIQDRLVCGVCRGEKVLVNESSGKNDICPKCKGRGYLPTDQELKEARNGKAKVILYG